jgi:hypothetical protein
MKNAGGLTLKGRLDFAQHISTSTSMFVTVRSILYSQGIVARRISCRFPSHHTKYVNRERMNVCIDLEGIGKLKNLGVNERHDARDSKTRVGIKMRGESAHF